MIQKPQVLDDEVTPEHELVVHRRDELEAILDDLRPRSGQDVTGHSYLIGPAGVGKTMVAKVGLEKLRADGVDFRSAYVNCWEHYERNDILFEVADSLLSEVIHRMSTPRGDLISALDDEPDAPRYVILDEVDQLADKSILYDLHSRPNIKVIYIANTEEELFSNLDDRVVSRVGVGNRIEFEAYSVRELSSILEKRAEYAFTMGCYLSDQQLERMAQAADGDARRVIRILRVAAETAERESRSIIDQDVREAIPRALDQIRQKSIDQLNDHQRCLYDIIAEKGAIAPQAIIQTYRLRMEDPRSDRTVRSYLSKMSQYRLIESDGKTRSKTYSLYEE
jgi:Cdc6-like AAA superfamily ATPase